MFYYLTSSGTREGDNVVFVRESDNLFDPSCVKVGLSRDRCVFIFKNCHLEARVTFIINPLGTLLCKCSVFCVLCNYYVIFVTSR